MTNDTPAPLSPTATLAGTVTEVSLLAGTATVTVMLENTEYVARGILLPSHFSVTDTVAGTVSVPVFARDSATEVTLTLAYTGEDITADGTLSVTLAAAGHTGAGDLMTETIAITASAGIVLSPEDLTVSETRSASYNVSLSSAPSGPVNVAIADGAGSDGLTFDRPHWPLMLAIGMLFRRSR